MIGPEQTVVVVQPGPSWAWWVTGIVVPLAVVVAGWWLNMRRKRG